MKIDHIKSRGSTHVHRSMQLYPIGSPVAVVAELIHHDDDDTVYLYAKGDGPRLGIYYIAPGDLVVYAVTHDGHPEDSEGDDHGE